MRRSDQESQRVDEFFRNLKEHMKLKGKVIRLSEFRSFHRDRGLESKLKDYLSERIRSHTFTEAVIEDEIKKMLAQRKTEASDFKIERGYITYTSKYKSIVNEDTLIKEVEKSPKGLVVDDQLLKFTFEGIVSCIRSAILKRKVYYMKSKQVEKQKEDEKYFGCILLAIPVEIRPFTQALYKTRQTELERDVEEKRPKARLEVKTLRYKDLYQKSCKENENKLLAEPMPESGSADKRTNSQWEDINRQAIENYDQLIEEYMKKNMKK